MVLLWLTLVGVTLPVAGSQGCGPALPSDGMVICEAPQTASSVSEPDLFSAPPQADAPASPQKKAYVVLE